MEPQDEKKLRTGDLKNTENIEQTNHPWCSLTTVSTFDQGNNVTSTLRVNESQNSEHVTQQMNSASIFIQSLIKQLCSSIEKDKIRRKHLYYAICDKLHKINLIDDSYNMIELDRLRGQYQHALYQLLALARAMTGNESSLHTFRYLTSESYRYNKEFHEVGFIASGGFGEVWKAVHRLDKTEYAIKKIVVPFKRIKIIKKYLDEVETLAKLNHANIVSYKVAWIEPMLAPPFVLSPQNSDRESQGSNISETEFTEQTKSHNLQSIKDSSSKRCDLNHSENNEQDISFCKTFSTTGTWIVNESNTKEYKEELNSDLVSFRNSNGNLNQTTEDNTDHTDYSSLYKEITNYQKLCTYSNTDQQYVMLYIQMALCEQTLEQWMRRRLNITPEPMVRAILQQILCGVNYIHSKQIVHHDIKPGNIFISTSGQLQIQLGDFGLACPLQREGHHSIMGTRMYAAPEQLQGKCDPKSDIYSVGIVLTELLIPTKTQMELISIINYLKCGNIPEALAIERHKWAQLIMQLVQEDPVKRPCSSQLLQDLNEEKDMITGLKNTVVTLENDNQDKDNKIHALEDKIVSLEKEIKKLKLSRQDTH